MKRYRNHAIAAYARAAILATACLAVSLALCSCSAKRVAEVDAHDDASGHATGSCEIVCWGDSLTEGLGASPALIVKDGMSFNASYLSYPEILEKLTGITTFNFGVSGATSEEIAYMQGALQGKLAPDALEIVDDRVMELGREHTGDVLVLEIGSNGGWGQDYNTLIGQYQDMIAYSGCDSYIIIGDTDDPGTSIADLGQEPFFQGQGTSETAWETALREAFGDRFVNMRVFLIERGLETAGLEETEKDAMDAAKGCISKQLRSDWTHLNSYGYFAKATAVYEKGQQLSFW